MDQCGPKMGVHPGTPGNCTGPELCLLQNCMGPLFVIKDLELQKCSHNSLFIRILKRNIKSRQNYVLT